MAPDPEVDHRHDSDGVASAMIHRHDRKGQGWVGMMTRFFRTTGLLIIGMVFLLVGTDRTLGVYDEGIVLTGAMRLLEGQWPHRDFYANYGPGQFSVIAALFSLVGEAAWPTRLFDAFARSLAAVFVFLLVVEAGRRRVAFAAWLVALWVLMFTDYAGYPVYPAMAASLGGALWLQRSLRADLGRLPAMTLAAGVWAGVAGLFRYDIGFFAWASGMTTLLMVGLMPAALLPGRAGQGRLLIRAGVWWSIGALLPIVPLLLAFASVGALPGFIHDVVVYPATLYPKMRDLPFPRWPSIRADWTLGLVYLPVVVALGGAAAWLTAWHAGRPRSTGNPAAGGAAKGDPERGRPTDPTAAVIAALVVLLPLVAFFYLKGYVRVSVIHMVLAIIPAIGLLAVLPLRPVVRQVPVIICVAVALLLLAMPTERIWTKFRVNAADHRHLLADYRRNGEGVTPIVGSCRVPPSSERMRCLKFEANRWQAADYVRSRTSPADRLFVGTTRHDKIFANDVAIYFVAGRLPATRWHHYDPGIQSTEPVQLAMIDEMAAKPPPWIVLVTDWDAADEPNESRRSSGVRLLDDWLAGHYQEAARFGSVIVLQFKG